MAPSDRLRFVKKIIKKETYWKIVFKTGYPQILYYCCNPLQPDCPYSHHSSTQVTRHCQSKTDHVNRIQRSNYYCYFCGKDFHRADVLKRHRTSGGHERNFRRAFSDIGSGLYLLLEFGSEYFVGLSELD